MRTDATTTESQMPAGLNRAGQIAPVIGGIGLIALLAGFGIAGRADFIHAYFFGYIVVLSLTLGCLGLTLMHNALRAAWGFPVIRLLEAGNKMLLPLAVLFIPICLFLPDLYPWATDKIHTDPALIHRASYMNPSGFMLRAFIYFAYWIIWGSVLNRWSRRQDETGDTDLVQRRINFASLGLPLFFLSITFAFVDFVMSLMPHWYSSIYGLIFLVGEGLAAFSFVTLIVTTSVKTDAYRRVVTPALTRDLGNLTLTFTMLWAYTALSQFLIQWSGNLPEEAEYYVIRNTGALLPVGTFVLLGQFFIPFVCLLSPRTKRSPALLRNVVIWILIVRVVDLFWIIKPMWGNPGGLFGLPLNLFDIASLLGFGGLWLFGFVWNLKRNRLFPLDGPLLEMGEMEAVSHA